MSVGEGIKHLLYLFSICWLTNHGWGILVLFETFRISSGDIRAEIYENRSKDKLRKMIF